MGGLCTCARALRWTWGQQGVWSRITLGTLLVPALPALGAGTLGIGGDRAVPNEMTWGQEVRGTQDTQEAETRKVHLLTFLPAPLPPRS